VPVSRSRFSVTAAPRLQRRVNLLVPRRSFQKREYGIDWYQNKQELLEANPGPVLVGSAYAYESKYGEIRQARKYASFNSHYDYWSCIGQCSKSLLPHSFHEIFPAQESRCLYFDLDGKPEYRMWHDVIVSALGRFVRWFFCGDRLQWEEQAPEPVVHTSSDPSKYSCHVISPDIFQEPCGATRIHVNTIFCFV